MMLEPVRNVPLGVHEEMAWQSNDSFIQPTPGRRRQFGNRRIRHVDADHSEVAIFEFPNVGTAGARGRFSTILMRVRADSAKKNIVAHIVIFVAPGGRADY
jgi:hypothetical protein